MSLIEFLRSTGGLTFSAFEDGASPTVLTANSPWEGNKGENQHYTLRASGGEMIAGLRIDYTDPLGHGNTIQDIHNIDVHTVPEPATGTAALLGFIVLGGLAATRRKRSRH